MIKKCYLQDSRYIIKKGKLSAKTYRLYRCQSNNVGILIWGDAVLRLTRVDYKIVERKSLNSKYSGLTIKI